MKKASTGVLSARPVLSLKLKSGSRNGSQPPQAMNSCWRPPKAARAFASLAAPGSPAFSAAARISAAGPGFSDSTSCRPKSVSEGVPRPASCRSTGLSDFRFTGSVHDPASKTSPAKMSARKAAGGVPPARGAGSFMDNSDMDGL